MTAQKSVGLHIWLRHLFLSLWLALTVWISSLSSKPKTETLLNRVQEEEDIFESEDEILEDDIIEEGSEEACPAEEAPVEEAPAEEVPAKECPTEEAQFEARNAIAKATEIQYTRPEVAVRLLEKSLRMHRTPEAEGLLQQIKARKANGVLSGFVDTTEEAPVPAEAAPAEEAPMEEDPMEEDPMEEEQGARHQQSEQEAKAKPKKKIYEGKTRKEKLKNFRIQTGRRNHLNSGGFRQKP